jgi:hypothetical protein
MGDSDVKPWWRSRGWSGGMAGELVTGGRRYLILSEPRGELWMARVVVADENSEELDEVGIEATGETRGAADLAADRKLRRLLRLPPSPDCTGGPNRELG